MTENEEIEAEQPTDNSREGKKAAAALDSVTDHHEEKEFSGGASIDFINDGSLTRVFRFGEYLEKIDDSKR